MSITDTIFGRWDFAVTIFGRWDFAVADDVYIGNRSRSNIGALTCNSYQ